MSIKKQYIYVIAICLSIIGAGVIIANRPQSAEEDYGLFKFPTGIPPSIGTMSTVSLGDEQINAIVISGAGSVSAESTQATLTLGVWTEDPVAAEAVEDNAQLMDQVIEAIKGLGILEDDMKTISYNVYPNYDWEARRVTSYRVTNTIQIEVKEVKMVGDVIDAAAGAGANNIQGISFGLSDEEVAAVTNEAYVKALQNARDKADLIAETLEIEVTGVVYVTESSYSPYTPLRGYAEAAMDAVKAPTPIIEGTLSVSVTVQVAFSFQ